jgi:hypothetical protein
MITTLAILALVALLIGAFVVLWRRRARARRWLEALAAQYGIARKPSETDEDLRARCRAVLSPYRGPTEAGLTELAIKIAVRYGYPAAVSIDRERGLVSVKVHMAPSERDLIAIERELADHLPMTIGLEVVAA